MHICSIITSFTTGGAETLVGNLSRYFVEAGHQASIVALSNAQVLGNSPEAEIQIMARLRGLGISVGSLGLDSRRSMFKGRRALGRYLQETRPDILHLHTARAVLMAGLSRVSAPLILTHHNSRLSFPRHLYKFFDQFAFAYVGISADCASKTRKYARRPVRLILNGADLSIGAQSARAVPSEPASIIAVGTISDQKDYPTLIAAAKCLLPRFEARHRTFRIDIVGGGEQIGRLQDMVRGEGLDSCVRLLGLRNDVPELLQSADLYVNSSLYEGLSIAMIEGLMSALPVVATDVAGNRELVKHGENGLLVPPADPDALASAIATALLSRGLYAQLSSKAVISSKAFTMERCAEEHLNLYEEAIAANFGRRRAA